MPANPFRRRAPAPDLVTPAEAEALWAVARAHVTAEATVGRAWTDGVTLGRCYGVVVAVRDCAGGDRVDRVATQGDRHFYRCRACDRLLPVLVGDPEREGDADGA